ncbi:hypothetical protein ZHAS_00017128 [Anopheles sinensis]|uniref:Uncharacterized protein n=1 Tax=Anopheles sinensis TaxID=74873 RepID=A0A084WF73_ANOSI|nr:hypothetical protein ZHAS_00017128 [Anopheles sinensis]
MQTIKLYKSTPLRFCVRNGSGIPPSRPFPTLKAILFALRVALALLLGTSSRNATSGLWKTMRLTPGVRRYGDDNGTNATTATLVEMNLF